VLIIRRSNCINTASGIVPSVSDRPVCRLRRSSFSTCTLDGHLQRILYQMLLLNLHTGRSLTEDIIPDAPSQPAHRTVTYREYYTRCSFSTCTPDGHLQRILYQMLLLNLHTGQSLTEYTIPDAPSQPAHRTVTYRGYYTRCCINTI